MNTADSAVKVLACSSSTFNPSCADGILSGLGIIDSKAQMTTLDVIAEVTH